MAEAYDLILKGGTVVNQDGEGVRDVAVAGRPDRGDRRLSGAAPARPSTAAACTSCPA